LCCQGKTAGYVAPAIPAGKWRERFACWRRCPAAHLIIPGCAEYGMKEGRGAVFRLIEQRVYEFV